MNTNTQSSRVVTVLHEDGSQEEITIATLRLSQYEDALKHMDDEFALVGRMCNKDRKWVMTLTAESYEELCVLTQELNLGGFFKYAGRQMAMGAVRAGMKAQVSPTAPAHGNSPQPR